MMEYDEARKRQGIAPKTAEEVEREHERRSLLESARAKLDENYDEVKAMNKVILEAKCVATREAQHVEREKLKQNEKDFDRRMEELMLEEDHKAQQVYAERERRRLEEQRRNAETIKDQLQEREIDRVRKLERHQQEQEAMTRHIARLHEEEHAEKLRRQQAARRLMEDAAIANAEQMALKKQEREMELAEDRKMADYIKQREEREQALEEEKQRLHMEKEKEIARLRSTQQRAQDKRAEMDEIRARRAQEAHDREQKKKEKETKERNHQIQEEIRQARDTQIAERARIKESDRAQEQEELDRIYAIQKVAHEQELENRAQRRQMQDENSLALLKQMMEVEERRRLERQTEVEDGNRMKREERERYAAMEAVRQRKLAELDQLQVPEQYKQALLKASVKK
ncbi:flagella associated protein [Strigomonas culicis]|nr:flagella associated protein [Strigomonas culicis]|eukprot:EPY31744.1 flagella associated protein [Strigomonas culicis]